MLGWLLVVACWLLAGLEVTDDLCFLRVIQNMSRTLQADHTVSSEASSLLLSNL